MIPAPMTYRRMVKEWHMHWVELSVEAHPEAVDAIADVFRQHGTNGVAVEQPIQSHIEGEEPPVATGNPIIRAFLPANDRVEEEISRIESDLWHLQAFDLSPIGTLHRRDVEEEDWAHGWKEHFHPLKIGRVVIKPSWRDWEETADEIVVELDPGMAFGTGLHPTTKLMIEGLQARVRPGMEVLDLGTGSGILAIPAARLGARVTALDISDVAVEVARENVAINGVGDRVSVAEGTIEAVAGRQFDLILANIIASVLIDIAPVLAASLRRGGEVLASGIIDERVELVRAAYGEAGLQITDGIRDGDWWLVVARSATL
jgi:ribosomal protein L11 methyltransferase